MQLETKQFTVALVGDRHVGKTTFMKRLTLGSFEKRYRATMCREEFDHTISATCGKIKFTVRNFSHLDGFHTTCRRTECHRYYDDCDAFIIMFDVTSKISAKNIIDWKREVEELTKDACIIVVGNKVDTSNRVVKRSTGKKCAGHHKYYEVSAKSCYNFDKPFLHLAKRLTGNCNLDYVDEELSEEQEDMTEHIPVVILPKQIVSNVRIWNAEAERFLEVKPKCIPVNELEHVEPEVEQEALTCSVSRKLELNISVSTEITLNLTPGVKIVLNINESQ